MNGMNWMELGTGDSIVNGYPILVERNLENSSKRKSNESSEALRSESFFISYWVTRGYWQILHKWTNKPAQAAILRGRTGKSLISQDAVGWTDGERIDEPAEPKGAWHPDLASHNGCRTYKYCYYGVATMWKTSGEGERRISVLEWMNPASYVDLCFPDLYSVSEMSLQ